MYNIYIYIYRVFRREIHKKIPSISGSLHILLLKCERSKYPRNPNAHIIELFCETQFFGPVGVALTSENAPYELHSFVKEYLNDIHEYNSTHNKIYPPPLIQQEISNYLGFSGMGSRGSPLLTPSSMSGGLNMGKALSETASYPQVMLYTQTDISHFKLEKAKQLMDDGLFYIYRFKTIYCPNINLKHDWNLCLYAHKSSELRYIQFIYIYIEEHQTSRNTGQRIALNRHKRGVRMGITVNILTLSLRDYITHIDTRQDHVKYNIYIYIYNIEPKQCRENMQERMYMCVLPFRE